MKILDGTHRPRTPFLCTSVLTDDSLGGPGPSMPPRPPRPCVGRWDDGPGSLWVCWVQGERVLTGAFFRFGKEEVATVLLSSGGSPRPGSHSAHGHSPRLKDACLLWVLGSQMMEQGLGATAPVWWLLAPDQRGSFLEWGAGPWMGASVIIAGGQARPGGS